MIAPQDIETLFRSKTNFPSVEHAIYTLAMVLAEQTEQLNRPDSPIEYEADDNVEIPAAHYPPLPDVMVDGPMHVRLKG